MDSGADAREAVEGAAARDDGHGTGTAQAAQESTVSPAALEVSPASNAAPVVEETRSEQGQDGQAEDAEEAGGSRQDSGAFKGGDAPAPAGTDSLRWRKRSREPDEPGAGLPEESAPRTRPTPSQGCIRESESECPGSAKRLKSQSITEASLGSRSPCLLSVLVPRLFSLFGVLDCSAGAAMSRCFCRRCVRTTEACYHVPRARCPPPRMRLVT